MNKRTTFRCNRELFHADTCQPLKVAAKQGDVCLAALGRGSYPGERLPRRDMKEVCMVGYRDTNNAKLKILINELILLLAEMLVSRNPLLDQSLSSSERTVRLFLENLSHRCDEPWTLDSMAAHCGLGRTHFSSYCKKLSNAAPVEYLTRTRMEAATRFLTHHPELSITEIAFRCGFQSSQYFSNVFRKQHGHSPSEYRSRH